MWRIPYFIIGGVYLISVIFFIVVSKYALRFAHINQIFNHKYQSEHASGEDNKNIEEESFIILNTKKKTAWFYIIVLALRFLVTALFYSIMSNITVFLTSVHKLPQDIGIYISVLAPVTIAIGPMITINECNKHPNFIAVGIKYMIIVVAITLLMVLFYKVSVILSLLLIIAYVVIVNGVKSIALSIMTVKMKTQINSGAFSAISNAIASIAAGVMPTVFGLILDNFGWTISFSTTLVLAVVILVSLIVVNGVIEKTNKNNIN
jgi:hypothetical protein